ncbi:Stk1 family PASTA domain-containing Ser/Thr kinase [Mechercharimyces sp. CAU 1602]|uniref:Stk1 family PASTA domain-containing Ser/Thr kinase n=1 Tax=Mechercharimyces sp. CAU 1602 TaxID=2973933 RepID=UPI0021611C7D|nr:Stk1 family PASTA domain-containing Ser/Thr kinase [Mechercharimyces sp. CAU 1602]MCS1351388.1 Stk1 family PASTA domain-containing Ser/Thr kinase [Mechercharimyces sp. CAU 1602]
MIGRKLGDRYEVVSRVGGGGMAVVYKAKDIMLNRYVALKVLNESLSNDREFLRRFSREAQAAASLSHPNVVSVYDVGRDGYTHYIVMEYIEGPTLKEMIEEHGPVPPTEAAHLAAQICDGLAHAHDNGIVHRDIKPHNILIGAAGRVKVTDFGIARATTSSTITQTGSVMGSVHYFSPEQARGGFIGQKSDIYSLGVVMYEMVTGQLPFDGESAISIALKHLQEDPVNIKQLAPDIPDSLQHIIRKAMEKEPDMRFESARELMKELRIAFPPKWGEEPQWTPMLKQREIEEEPLPPRGNTTREFVAAAADEQENEPSMNDAGPTSTGRQHTAVGQETMTKLERLRGVSADKDKTVFQKTVVWLENAQANMPFWQKTVFFLFTISVILVLAFTIFNVILSLNSNSFFSSDDGSGTSAQEQSAAVELIDLEGKSREEARSWLEDKGFNVQVEEQMNHDFGAGEVHGQEPAAGTELKTGETVTLYANAAEGDLVEVPEFIGDYESSPQKGPDGGVKQWIAANDELQIKIERVKSGSGKMWTVVDQDPKPGTMVERGTEVTVYIKSK